DLSLHSVMSAKASFMMLPPCQIYSGDSMNSRAGSFASALVAECSTRPLVAMRSILMVLPCIAHERQSSAQKRINCSEECSTDLEKTMMKFSMVLPGCSVIIAQVCQTNSGKS